MFTPISTGLPTIPKNRSTKLHRYQEALKSNKEGFNIAKLVDSMNHDGYHEAFLDRVSQIYLQQKTLEKAFDTYLRILNITRERERVRERLISVGYEIRKKQIEENGLAR